tara:strand:+ start:788 stop:1000 length:213 start_codon:yes stop_codon:yes gene_type:complete
VERCLEWITNRGNIDTYPVKSTFAFLEYLNLISCQLKIACQHVSLQIWLEREKNEMKNLLLEQTPLEKRI